jgi:hypothetical protein
MTKIFVVKSGKFTGMQVWPCSIVATESLYPNLKLNPISDRFYASTSFSYLWTDAHRPSWFRDEVEEIVPQFAAKAIVNHGSGEECHFTRYFESDPSNNSWLYNNLNHRSKYNPHLVGEIDNPFLVGWLAAWEWDRPDGGIAQLRLGVDGKVSQHAFNAPSYKERKRKYDLAEREAARQVIKKFEQDAEHLAWQDSMRRK